MARHRQPPYDPLAPVRPRVLRRQVRRDVLASFTPLARQITREFDRRTRAGTQNITGVSSELARGLTPLAATEQGIYGAARDDLGKIDTAIADRLTAAGKQGADTLKQQASLSGIPSALVESLTGGAERVGSSAAASRYAHGGAEQAALAAHGAAAAGYAAKLPGLAQLSGLQGVRDLEAASHRDQTSQLDRLRSQMPSLLASELRDARNREVNKAVARMGNATDVFRAETSAATSAANNAATTSTSRANNAATNQQRRKDRQERRRAARAAAAAKKKKNSNPFGDG